MESAREYLLRIPEFAREKHTLREAEEFLRELDSPFPGTVIHVAGTNGKGSVCAFLSSILQASGYRVGTFTSPHLTDVRERICVDGEPIDEKAFQRSFERVRRAWERQRERGMTHPTFFEFLFYMAAACFQEEKPEVVILEAGMGGKRDVTNVCRPALTVITSVSLDHMAYLGNTVEEIAGEKAGIIKPGVPLVFDGNDPAAAAVIRNQAETAGAPWRDVRQEPLSVAWDGPFPRISFPFLGERVQARLPFPAEYQVWNGALAGKAAEVLAAGRRDKDFRPGQVSHSGNEQTVLPFKGVTVSAVSQGLAEARHAGRMEEVLPGVYFDGAHNRDGIRAFCQAADRIAGLLGKPAYLLFSAVSDKEYGTMAEELLRELKPAEVFVAHMENGRGLSAGELETAFARAEEKAEETGGRRPGIRMFPSVSEAFSEAMKEKKAGNGLLFCAGSLYFIGELKECLKEEKHDQF